MRGQIIVVGCGVMGLSTATILAEAGHRVRVVARDPVERTTSATAGALWEPYRTGPEHLVIPWAQRTFRTLEHLARIPEETGVRMVEGLKAHSSSGELPLPAWSDGLPGIVTPIAAAEVPAGYRSGYRARLPLLDMAAYLAYLVRRLARVGGVIEHRQIATLAEIAEEAPYLINCAGLGARDLVPDPQLRPVRGQLVVTENPGIQEWFVEARTNDDGPVGLYIFPQPHTVVLGGTAEEGQWDVRPDPAVADQIIRRAARIHPALADARVVAHRVGLRPYRPRIRLEREVFPTGCVCVHNYGHGGSGITLSWACAEDAAALLTTP
jgi:D-amino-acid oxidase